MIIIQNKKTYKGDGHYVGRPSILGNPFSHLSGTKAQYQVETREQAVAKYKDWFYENLKRLDFKHKVDLLVQDYKKNKKITLICWCYPLSCHCDVIKEYILNESNK